MEGAWLPGIALAILAGYTYAVARRTWSDHKGAKEATKKLGSKRWSDLVSAVVGIGLLLLVLRVFFQDL